MKNITKAQLYQFVKSREVLLIILGVNIICTAIALMFSMENSVAFIGNTGSAYAANSMSITVTFIYMLPSVICGKICADDFQDKTINYEAASGSLRWQSYFGRAIPSLILSLILCLITIGLPLVIVTAMHSWGDLVTPSSAIIRIFTVLLPIFRVSCFNIMMSFIIKKDKFVVVISCIGSVFASFISGMSRKITYGMFSQVDIMKLLNYKYYTTYGLNDEKNVWGIYDSTIDISALTQISVVSLIVGIIYICVGYFYHKHDDLN